MHPYKVHTFFVCKITGKVEVEISLSMSDEYDFYRKAFACEDNARAHIRKEKRDWLLGVIEKYIHHKKHIIENGDQSRKPALDVCLHAYAKYHDSHYNVKQICAAVVKGKKYFEGIIPSTSNKSYQSSVDTFTKLLQFCEQETTQ